jgi:hypothetical protein
MVEANKKYGKLTTLYKNGRSKNRNIIWHCRCDCGKELDVPSGSLTTGNTRSCGCLLKETARKNGIKSRKLNKYDLSGDYGIGYTTNGEPFYFDKEDYELIKNYTWSYNPEKYVQSSPFGKILKMHILIMSPPKGKVVDHINHITFDNRKVNLRVCERYQNSINTLTYKNNTSGRKGVYWDKARNKWMVCITANKKTYNLGRYDDFDEAVRVREEAEEKYHKEFRCQ